MKVNYWFAVACVCSSSSVIAQTERELDSHMHGSANLNVAVVDSAVYLEFNTPWNNLVGFEHAPNTDEQHALVDDALKLLNTPDELFSFKDGDCMLDEVMLENNMMAEHDDEHGDEHGDEHDEEHKDEHDDEHDHNESESSHSSVMAIYSYQCKQIDKLDQIDLSLFERWSALMELDVQLVGASSQTLVELDRNATSLDVSAIR